MDGLTQKVVTLTDKVDALYEMITQLTNQVCDHLSPEETPNSSGETIAFPPSLPNVPQTRKGLSQQKHKDILIDNEYMETSYYNQELSLTADIQIQRLTAQLTAAYNRIAALEEQLLSQRVHF
ncbi:hypothetical protein PA905_09020 [Planktothrix agardhii CCAP 1459/11A]|jgi:hypothetical protein|uniref:Uncharacterized protein n=1 Tax=Planktothrix agardhii CCAP 1459/11A TaxID=282420 RepID=A0A4P5ZWU2_PLAAG|nr:hypothetical protein [Planktothrix agardhii]GDZ93067.1 hypothetical protein PA905_09020 [Planktothrix agardhii CCAP 1459/11A]CAD5979497.1 hypothetical protein NO108_04841 [Planktothrix rubescens]